MDKCVGQREKSRKMEQKIVNLNVSSSSFSPVTVFCENSVHSRIAELILLI